MDGDEVVDTSDLARKVDVSIRHVTQILGLFQLDTEAQLLVLDFGDPIVNNRPGVRSLWALIVLLA